MPGFPFGPMRPNTRAGLPLTARVLVPAVRRSLAVRVSDAAAARGRKGIVPAIATPDATICRRVSSERFSFSLIAACPCDHVLKRAAHSMNFVRGCSVRVAMTELRDAGFPQPQCQLIIDLRSAAIGPPRRFDCSRRLR